MPLEPNQSGSDAEFRAGPPGRLVKESTTDQEDGSVLRKRTFIDPDGRTIEKTILIPPVNGAPISTTYLWFPDE